MIQTYIVSQVRRPFDIGDRVHISNVESDPATTGTLTWIVKDVTLFTTTVVLGASNEIATYSNGSLANSRIVNAARSPQAVLHFTLKFPIDADFNKLKIYRSAIEKFVKDRPRQWLSFLAFRVTRVEADGGFVEYIVVGQHRESWQNIGALLTSKAELTSFAWELSKKMGLRYVAPALPVNLNVKSGSLLGNAGTPDQDSGIMEASKNNDARSLDTYSNLDMEGLEAMFSPHS